MLHRTFTVELGAILFLTLASSVDGATRYVASNGLDGAGCGAKASPCRSISHAINVEASDGDSIVVGPGRYGDLNDNFVLGDSPGEESGGFGCMILVARAVTVTSSDGAASTLIEGTTVDLDCNVGIAVDGTKFGKPGKGFMVTNPAKPGSAILIAATDVTVAGNQVIALTGFNPMSNLLDNVIGIDTVDFPGTALIEENQVMGWNTGIRTRGANKTVRRNQVSRNCVAGISLSSGSTAEGNVTTGNGKLVGPFGSCGGIGGITLNGASTAVGNGSYGNSTGFSVDATFSGTLRGNNLFGNRRCGLQNAGAPAVLAAENYWGAATGPGPDPADDVCNLGGATTTTAPFATKPFKVRAKIKP